MNFRKELAIITINLFVAGLIIILGMSYIKNTSTPTVKTLSSDKSLSDAKIVSMSNSLKKVTNDSRFITVENLSLTSEHHSTSQLSHVTEGKTERTQKPAQANSKVAGSSISSSKNKFQEIYKVPKGYCALTFDDGPSDYSVRIAKLLKAYNAPATFFVIGENVNQYPSIVKYESQLGFSVQDHSETHPVMSRLSAASQTQQILQAKKEIEALTHKPVTLFRPPYGSFNSMTKDILVKNHMQMALWNDDPRDWNAKTADALIKTISKSNLSGTVIDLHDKKITYQALPGIIKVIKSKGLKLTSI